MRIAIMQPYFFPYIGYFQLIKAADMFIFFDDVSYIKKGWINRNYICINKHTHCFSVPIENASQSRSIRKTLISKIEYIRWTKKFIDSLTHSYKKQLYFAEGMSIVEKVLSSSVSSIADLAIISVQACCKALGISTPMHCASAIPSGLAGENRLIEICHHYGANRYINAPGGKSLYNSTKFASCGIRLEFLQTSLSAYPVKGRDCITGLSVLDAILCCGQEYTGNKLLCGYGIEEVA